MKKLRSRRGFTIAETLICVALLAIMSAAGAVASGVVISVRNGMIASGDAETLGSTALEALANEVRYGQNIKFDAADNKLTSLDSATFGPGVSFTVKPNVSTGDSKDVVWVEGPDASVDTDDYKLLDDKAYSVLEVKTLTIQRETDSGGNPTQNVKITVSVGKNDTTTDSVWTGEVTVKPMNGIK